MKRITILVAFALALATTACRVPTTPVPLAPGYYNTADQTMGETLSGIHAGYVKLQSEITAGTITPAGNMETAILALKQALTVADGAYLAYHNGTATEAQAQAAVNKAASAQAAQEAAVKAVK